MTCRRVLFCAVLLPLAPMLLTPMAHAAGLDTRLNGSSLSIATPCARQIEIRPDPALHGQVTIHAAADHQEELDRLLLDTQGSARVHTKPSGCWQPTPHGEFTPTLAFLIVVPVGFPLAIDESGAGSYAIGPVGGPLALDLSGAVQLRDARATTLDAALSGADTLTLARVDGDAHVDLSGQGQLTIDDAVIPKLSIDLSGAGAVALSRGHVDRANLSTSGAGQIHVGATIGDADVDVSGMGSVRLATVTGRLQKAVSGMGTISVGP
jgi:hypothetical protein